MKIVIVSSQYFWLPEEAGPTRFYSIAKVFKDAGNEVDFITSSFEHHEKKQRDKSLKSPFKMIYIDCPSYKRNFGISREISNIVFTREVAAYLKESGKQYDAVYCSIPPNNIGAVVGKYCHENRIPYIADIEDLWPEAMGMIVPKPLRFLFHSYFVDAEKTYKYVDAVVGTSEEYSLRASKNNGREIPYRTVYVGCDVDAFDYEAKENWNSVNKPDGQIWITYAGSIGHSYAIDNLVRAAKILQDMGENEYRFKVLGSGPLKEDIEKLSQELACNNIEFLGYVAHPLMTAYVVKSDVLVNSFAKEAPQSIVNKIGDYLAAGKPMVNTLENEEMCKLVDDYGFGVNVPAEDPEKLADAIVRSKKWGSQGEKARKLAEIRFDRKTSYLEIVELLESVVSSVSDRRKEVYMA